MSKKPYIKIFTCESGDWQILQVNCGEDFEASGHKIETTDWIRLLDTLGYKVEHECLTDEEMDKLC